MLTSKFDQATSSGNTCIQFLDIKIDIKQFSGDIVDRVTPVPIPNTEVKPIRADDTASFQVWESRKPPDLFLSEKPVLN